MAGKATLMIASSEMTPAPAAAIPRGTAAMNATGPRAPRPGGMAAGARATRRGPEGRRFLFSVEAWDAKDKIAEGRHERFVIPDLAKFLERAMKKGQA